MLPRVEVRSKDVYNQSMPSMLAAMEPLSRGVEIRDQLGVDLVQKSGMTVDRVMQMAAVLATNGGRVETVDRGGAEEVAVEVNYRDTQGEMRGKAEVFCPAADGGVRALRRDTVYDRTNSGTNWLSMAYFSDGSVAIQVYDFATDRVMNAGDPGVTEAISGVIEVIGRAK